MTSLIRSVRSGGRRKGKRSFPSFTLDEYIQQINYLGQNYSSFPATSQGNPQQEIPQTFSGLARHAYKANGPVFSCMLARMALFSEARFQYRQIRDGRPGQLFGNANLKILEKPYPNGTTGDLLARAMQDADLSGNWYCTRQGDQLNRLQPDWVTIVMGSKSSPETPSLAFDAEVLGYIYKPPGVDLKVFVQEQVAHFAPIPDPEARFRGMSWVTPIIRDVMGDQAATDHKLSYFEHAATSNLVVTFDKDVGKEDFDEWVDAFEAEHAGAMNAYKTFYLGAGATPTPIGANLQQADFRSVQGAGETRIASAAGVPPIIAGFAEGLASGTYSNYGQACRRFADLTMRPLWRNYCGSIAPLIARQGGAELWYDDRDIAFLKQDLKDAAEVQSTQASTIASLINAGYVPDTVIEAVTSSDYSKLKHTGLYSVQLQPPGTVLGPRGANAPPEPAPSEH